MNDVSTLKCSKKRAWCPLAPCQTGPSAPEEQRCGLIASVVNVLEELNSIRGMCREGEERQKGKREGEEIIGNRFEKFMCLQNPCGALARYFSLEFSFELLLSW